jgi:hypothetical protein
MGSQRVDTLRPCVLREKFFSIYRQGDIPW